MFQKLANAVADQVVYKLAALNQAYSQNDTLAALRMEKKAHLQAAMKLAQLEKLADANLPDVDGFGGAGVAVGVNPFLTHGGSAKNDNYAKKLKFRQAQQSAALEEARLAADAERQLIENSDIYKSLGESKDKEIAKLTNQLGIRRADSMKKILGGSLAGLGLASGAGLGALGIANARKAKQLAKMKQLGLLGGGAAALGGLGLGYLMGDN